MPRIMVIDDQRANLIALEALLKHIIPDCDVVTAQSGLKGIEKARQYLPDTILLDIQMPVLDGYDVCRRLKEEPRTKNIPVIFITAIETDSPSRIKGLEIGGDAFITKPIQEKELAAQINAMLRISRSRGQLEVEKMTLEEKEQEKTRALKESEERYRTITENSPDIISRYDKNLRHLYVSPNIRSITGKEAGEFIGKTHREIDFPDEIRIPIEQAIMKTFETGEQQELEYWYNPPDNSSPIFINKRLKPEFNTDGSVQTVIGVSSDTTEKKKLIEQLHQAQKMEAIGTLAGGIAHDFNNILGVILGYTELVMEDTPKDTLQYENLLQVITAARRAEEMVKQILAFSRKSEEEKKPVYIRHILTEAIKMLRSTIPTTIDIQYNIGDNLGLVMANPTQIHQVIVNLATNAAYAMRENGGVLEINLHQLNMDKNKTKDMNLVPGTYQCLTIQDNGHGMSPEILERIFEPYFTTKKTGEGTGMGLSVVHGIVRTHGGDITVSSEPCKGTSFSVYFPVAKGIRKSVANIEKSIQGGTEHILFVDDESSLAEMGKLMLEKLGYQVTLKTDSLEALETFRQSPQCFDLVITDQTMPNLTGTQLTRKILEIRPDIPIILSTGFSETVNKENFKTLGIRAFAMKPIVKKDIAKIIRKVLEET